MVCLKKKYANQFFRSIFFTQEKFYPDVFPIIFLEKLCTYIISIGNRDLQTQNNGTKKFVKWKVDEMLLRFSYLKTSHFLQF